MKVGLDLRRRRLQLEALEERSLLSAFTVDRLTDSGQGSGLTGDLRYCLTQATSGQDTIGFGITGTINLTKALPDLTKSLSINGPGADLLTVRRDTGGSYRIFTVSSGVTVTIAGLTMANGVAPQPLQIGGAISNDGTLTVANCTFTGNSAFAGGGGAIYNSPSATLTVNRSMLSGNSSGDGVGGAVRNDGSLMISGSTLARNTATVGGAIYNRGTLTINNSTLSGDSANDGGAIDNNSGTLTVSNSTLSGNIASDGGGGAIQSVFGNPGTVIVSNSTLSGNSAAFFGSALDFSGALTLTNSIISGNRPATRAVGTIYMRSGTAMLGNSIVSANSSVGGGGIFVAGGTLTVSNSTISGNTGRDPQSGGGIGNSGTLIINNSTISGNTVNDPDSAGGILNRGSFVVSNSTISGNTDNFAGLGGSAAGGIGNVAILDRDAATVMLLNSTIANNTVSSTGPTGGQLVCGRLGSGTGNASIVLRDSIVSSDGRKPNFFVLSGGTFISQGHNLSSDTAAGFLTGPGDLSNIDPLLGPLQDNGGPTQTMALLLGSPAMDAGDNTNVPDFDQRGPGFARIVGGINDIGAFEVQPGPATQLQINATAHATPNASFSVTVIALDAFGHTATSYLGTVTFRSTDADPAVILPLDYAFTSADAGVHVFPNSVRLRSPGSQTITVADALTPSINGSVSIVITLPLFFVTTTQDSGPGSLRQAILDADATTGPDTIRFAVGAGQQTINLTSPLPAITQPVVIDGTSQPGYTGSPLIELNGTGAGLDADGLLITAGASVVRGLVINRFTLSGIELQNGGGNLVQGNYIGTDVTGTLPLGNGIGVRISASNNTIGGTTIGAGNVIAGNVGDGIFISSGTANAVFGNFIGTNLTGSMSLGNLNNGVHLLSSSGNTIGGTIDGASNMIGNNGNDGVLVESGLGNSIRHNAIYSHTNGLGIELVNGGNNRLAFPILISASSDGLTTTIQGLLQSTPNTSFTLEFFANSACNPSGFGEGQVFLGSSLLTSNSHGTVSFSQVLAGAVSPGQFIAATATDPDNNTSAFSNCVSVAEPPAPPALGPGSKEGVMDNPVLFEAIAPTSMAPRLDPATASVPTAGLLERCSQPLGRLATAAFFGRWRTTESSSVDSRLTRFLDELLSSAIKDPIRIP